MDYIMEDTQNSAPGQPTMHEAAKFSTVPRRQDAQSVTKRYTIPYAPPTIHLPRHAVCEESFSLTLPIYRSVFKPN